MMRCNDFCQKGYCCQGVGVPAAKNINGVVLITPLYDHEPKPATAVAPPKTDGNGFHCLGWKQKEEE